MASRTTDSVLQEAIWQAEGTSDWIKRAVLVVLGIAVLAIAAKIKVPMWPVPINMGTFAVFTIGAAYGPRLGLATILGYMIVGAAGFDVFANSTTELNGFEYMFGGTGGYLLGFVLATLALGFAARKGWDRNVFLMAGAMLLGNLLIYIPGILWLAHLYTWDKPILDWGLYPFLIGDGLKLALAALLVPGLWKLIGKART